ncbi:MAG: MFS transporter [Actinomycetia bacterium]|nr:MFS transporter [Actinomycetes bacterium]MCP4961367.1 MFS transporter [Actinomycetes bacterium]
MSDPQQDPPRIRDVISHRDFSLVLAASFVSNTGRWMQQVVLGVLAWELTGSSTFLGLVVFAQMGPMLVLSVIGGGLADSLDRKLLLLVTQAWQGVWGVVLAWQVADGDISQTTLIGLVFIIGVGQALYAPAFTAVLPSLVGRENLSAAISLNSMQVNGSRVIGPALGAWLASVLGVPSVLLINAATYLFVIGAVAVVTIPPTSSRSRSFGDRFLGGLRLARVSSQIRRPLLTMATFAAFCLPFIGQMPALAELNLGVDPESQTYGVLYATFGLGALAGAASVGTVLAHVPRPVTVRVALGCFAVALAVLSVLRSPTAAYPTFFAVGLFYFTMPVALSTFLQEHLADEVRGRVMALWTLSFGGVVSISNSIMGYVVEQTSVSAVVFFGSCVAAVLAVVVRLEPGPEVSEATLRARNDPTGTDN